MMGADALLIRLLGGMLPLRARFSNIVFEPDPVLMSAGGDAELLDGVLLTNQDGI